MFVEERVKLKNRIADEMARIEFGFIKKDHSLVAYFLASPGSFRFKMSSEY
jgi:hypothetical protein